MSDNVSAKIRGKGLEHTGVTEEHAANMYDHVGSHYVGVVSLQVVQQASDIKGKRSVELVIDTIELAPSEDTAEHVRRLTRSFKYERGLAVNGGDQLPIPGADEPTVEQVRGEGRAFEPDPEKDERDLAEKEAADATEDQVDDEEPVDPEPDEVEPDAGEQADDDWDEGPGPVIKSPFDVPDPQPAS